jgi:hypothetical protein
MKVEFDIFDETIQNFSVQARTEITRQSKRIAEEIIKEASLIEAGQKVSDAQTEVTHSNVIRAATSPRMVFRRKKRWWLKIIQILSSLSSIVVGSLFDTSKFVETSHVIWFIIMSFIAIGTTVYLTFNQENNE